MNTDSDLVWIKEQLITKEDGRLIREKLDCLVGQIKELRDGYGAIISRLKSHDDRIFKIEKYLKLV